MDLPIKGLDRLEPFLAVVALYLLFLIVLRLVLWPFLLALRQRNLLGRALAFVGNLLLRLVAIGGLLLTGLWALWVLGLQEDIVRLLENVPDLDLGDINVPTINWVIPVLFILLLLLLWFFAIRPALAFFRTNRSH